MKFFRPRSLPLWAAGVASLGALLIQLGCQQTAALPVAAAPTSPAAPSTKLAFNEHIQPILAENCYSCHGPDPGGRKASLRLDRATAAFSPHEKMGPAIVPGKPDESPLIQRIESRKENEIMPPPEAHKTLKPAEIALLRRWVSEGAAYQEHWAFITPQRPTVPASGKNPIDAFVQARLSREHLTPAPEADRRTLIRRVTLDLTGLPPSPTEVEAFLADRSPDAYERVVDRLLASPRYGEHRTRYWLDTPATPTLTEFILITIGLFGRIATTSFALSIQTSPSIILSVNSSPAICYPPARWMNLPPPAICGAI